MFVGCGLSNIISWDNILVMVHESLARNHEIIEV